MPRGEALHHRERAVELGVPESAVLVEAKARDSGEDILFSRALLARPPSRVRRAGRVPQRQAWRIFSRPYPISPEMRMRGASGRDGCRGR